MLLNCPETLNEALLTVISNSLANEKKFCSDGTPEHTEDEGLIVNICCGPLSNHVVYPGSRMTSWLLIPIDHMTFKLTQYFSPSLSKSKTTID